MEKIPNIPFKTQKAQMGIELIPLNDLIQRLKNTTDHNPYKPHKINFFMLYVITNGNGTHQVDLNKYELKRGSVLKIAKGQIHAFTEDQDYSGYCIVLTEDFLLRYFSASSIYAISHFYNYHISPPLVKDVPINDFFIEHFTKEFNQGNNYLKLDILAKILEIFLLRLERSVHSKTPLEANKKQFILFSEFKDLVDQEYAKTRNVKDYAKLLSISTKHLNTIVKEFTKNTAKSFIDQYVILEIKRTLLSSDISLKEVAFKVGFDEITNFTKFFKKHTGITPKDYK